jgi:hypothetical protein
MKGIMKKSLVMLGMAGGFGAMGCSGGEHYRNLVDPCWMERYSGMARQGAITCFTPQVQNGTILDQTLWNHQFERGTDVLNPAGQDKLDQLVRRRPEPDPRIFLQTARDLAYNPEKPDEYAAARRDLDAKRASAIQKYLAAQTAGRPMNFDVLVHDPSNPGVPAIGVRNAILSQSAVYTGALGTTGGGAGQNALGTTGGGTSAGTPTYAAPGTPAGGGTGAGPAGPGTAP